MNNHYSNNKRILVVTRNFPPLTGGMERLNYQAFLGLSRQNEVALCGPRGCKDFAVNNNCYEFSSSPAWRYVLTSILSAQRAATEFKPDIVYAGSGLAAPAALLAARKANAKCGVFLHGLDLIADNAIYQSLFLPAIRKCDFFFANSRHTVSLALNKGISKDRIHLVHPGVKLPDHLNSHDRRNGFRNKFQLGDRPVLLSAGRLSPRKGIVEFINQCLPSIAHQYPETCLIIIGAPPLQGLGRSKVNLKSDILEAISKHGLQKNVLLLGNCDDQLLSDAYFSADVFIFPTIDTPGDVEGFGMVAIEAAAHGLQTIAYATGGVTDAVSDGISGHLIPPGDSQSFTQAILTAIEAPLQREQMIDFADNFSWKNFNRKISHVINSQI